MNRTPEEIENDIEETRQAVDRTMEALKEKIAPDNLIGEFMRMIQSGGASSASSIFGFVRSHPASFALLGAGAAFLAIRARSSHANESGHGEYGEGRGSDAGYAAGYGARHAMNGAGRSGLMRIIEEEPLIVGAVAVAIGAAIGAALPSTPMERRMLGPMRDNAVQRVRGMAEERVQGVKNAVTGRAQRAQSESPGG